MTEKVRRPEGGRPRVPSSGKWKAIRPERAEILLTVFDHACVGLGIASDSGRWIDANTTLCDLLGYSREEMIRLKTADVIHPDDLPGHKAQRRRVKHGDRAPIDTRLRLLRSDGTVLQARVRVLLVSDEVSEIAQALIQVEDASAEPVVKDAPERSTADLSGLLDALPDPVAITRGGDFIYANGQFAMLVGAAAPSTVVGRGVAELIHPDDLERVRARVAELAHASGPLPPTLGRLLHHNGTWLTVECSAMPLDFDGGPSVVWICRNVADRMEQQSHALVTDRLAALGTLAAGAAHEINNPLAYIMANLDFIVAELDGRDVDGMVPRELSWEAQQALREIRGGAERVRAIVRDLRSFSRVDLEQREALDVCRVIDTTINLASSELRHRAEVVRAYGPVPMVVANEARLGQVFLNLLINAAQAAPEGRRERNVIRIVTRTEGDRAVIEVHDSGEGIPTESIARIFDPFYTTRQQGAGTGLGLSVCHGIVTGLGGEISAHSTPGVGTVVTVSLPGAREATKKLRSVPPAAAAPVSGNILVVDDERAVGTAIARLLSREHKVTTVTSAVRALEMVRAGKRWDLILCDVLMPEMTGMEFYAALGTEAPELVRRVVFLTGGAFTPMAREFLNNQPNPCLDKPFDVAVLRELVREVLSTAGPLRPPPVPSP